MSSFGDKAKSVIAAVAPTLGTVLGGPLGGLAGSFIAKQLGEADPKAQEQLIAAASPDTLMKLKQADNELEEHLAQIGVDKEKLRFDDTANARARQVALKDNTPTVIAYLVVGLVLFLEGSMFFVGSPKNVDPVIMGRILGTLDSALILVLGYFYGSSAGSASKTDTINAIASRASQPRS